MFGVRLASAGGPNQAGQTLQEAKDQLQSSFSEQADPPRLLHQYEAAVLASTGDPDGAMDALFSWAATTPDETLGSEGSLHWWWRPLQNRPDFQQFIARD